MTTQALTGLFTLLAPAVVLLSATLADADPTVLALATVVGLLAALVQFLGVAVGERRPPAHRLTGTAMASGFAADSTVEPAR